MVFPLIVIVPVTAPPTVKPEKSSPPLTGSPKLALPTMIDKVAGLAVYLVEHGNVVKDGNTFGGDERERFTVRYKTSDRFPGLPVFFCAAD